MADVTDRAQQQIQDDRQTVARQTGAPLPPTVGSEAPPATDTLDVAEAGAGAPRAAEQAARRADAEVRHEMKEDLKDAVKKLTGSD